MFNNDDSLPTIVGETQTHPTNQPQIDSDGYYWAPWDEEITIKSVTTANINGYTYYYITDENNKYKVSITLSDTLPFKKAGDKLTIGYYESSSEVIEVEKRTMDDRNIKLYYDENKNTLVDTNKIYEYQIKAGTLTKDIKDNAYDLSGSYSITVSKAADLQEINVYPITYDETNYKILDDKKTIKLVTNETKGVSFRTSYFFDDEEHSFKISIKFNKKETY